MLLVHPANEAVMSRKRVISIGLLLAMFIMVCINTSCKSRKGVCDANRQSKTMKMKKNRSNYGVRYSFKSKPVGKSYVIRNRR